jgi:hypothetical protein
MTRNLIIKVRRIRNLDSTEKPLIAPSSLDAIRLCGNVNANDDPDGTTIALELTAQAPARLAGTPASPLPPFLSGEMDVNCG